MNDDKILQHKACAAELKLHNSKSLRLALHILLGAEEGLEVLDLLLVGLAGLIVRLDDLGRGLQELLRRRSGLELLGLGLGVVRSVVLDLLRDAVQADMRALRMGDYMTIYLDLPPAQLPIQEQEKNQ